LKTPQEHDVVDLSLLGLTSANVWIFNHQGDLPIVVISSAGQPIQPSQMHVTLSREFSSRELAK
jgi:hypothetical protein